ncbi:MAG: 2-oxoglutarate dehydrogenase E1 component, partial [Bacteroidota bacterium]
MDRFSFLNAANTAFFADLYDQYIDNPDSVEPSWRAFFQGFDFAASDYGSGATEVVNAAPVQQQSDAPKAAVSDYSGIPEKLQKEFKVLSLIDGYRTRGHLFTKTNPVRERRNFSPTLDLSNFGLSDADLTTVFDAGKEVGMENATLAQIVDHLQKVYCGHIGIEYMYIRDSKTRQWIQNRLSVNHNQPDFNADQKKNILGKLNEAVSFENFLHTKYVGQKRFSLEGGESLIPALD